MRLNPKQTSFRCTFGISIFLAVLFLWRGLGLDYVLERELWLMRATGYTALAGLFLSLSMTPFSRLFERLTTKRRSAPWWLAFRRSFGMVAGSFALLHTTLVLSTYLSGSWRAVLNTPYLRAGLVTLCILIALLITSFPQVARWLRVRHWQHLHRLSYVAVLFLLQHVLLSPFASRFWVLLLFGCLLVVSLSRALGAPKRATGRLPES